MRTVIVTIMVQVTGASTEDTRPIQEREREVQAESSNDKGKLNRHPHNTNRRTFHQSQH